MGIQEYHKKRREYFVKQKVEGQLILFRKVWKKNYKKAHKLGWANWSFMKKLEFALKLIKQEEQKNAKSKL